MDMASVPVAQSQPPLIASSRGLELEQLTEPPLADLLTHAWGVLPPPLPVTAKPVLSTAMTWDPLLVMAVVVLPGK
jgi:hypothetical protein